MGIREQRVELGYGIGVLTRAVYDIRSNKKLGFQTGYVQYESNEVPVWRPYDPTDDSYDAKWRKGRWFNIYVLRMPRNPEARHLNYLTNQIPVGKAVADLPKVEVEYMYQFRDFLKAAVIRSDK